MFKHYFGWYDADPAQPAVRHRLTGQKLAFAGRISAGELPGITESINRHWLRFSYSDPEAIATLVVESLLPPGSWGRVWYVDYAKSFREPPGFGLWQRLDSFAIDALTCFPKSEALGEPATEIAALGGWRLGRWQTEVVRSQKPPPVGWSLGNPPVLSGYLPPLDAAPPAPWRLAEAGEDARRLPALKNLQRIIGGQDAGQELLSYLQDRLAADPYLMSADGSQMLIPAAPGFRESQFLSPLRLTRRWGWESGAEVTCAYLDKDSLYFGLYIRRDNHRKDSLSFSVRAWSDPRKLLRLHPERFAANELPGYDDPVSPGESSRGDALEPDRQCPMMPQWLGLRLRAAVPAALEALTATERPKTSPGKWRLSLDVENFADGADREYVLTDNGAEIAARRSEDGVLQAASRQKVHGWWDFDPEGPGMVNRITGQRITLREDKDLPRTLSRRPQGFDNWWLLTYSDGEVSCSVPVGRPATPHEDRDFGWAVLYDQRAAPPYGTWRRAHLAIVDALSCWPTTNAFGRASASVFTLGAWSNGRWQKDLCNSLKWGYSRQRPGPIPEAEPAVPKLAPAPAPWTFVDALAATGKGWLKGLTWDQGDDRWGAYTNSDHLYFSGVWRPLGGRVSFPFTGFAHEGPHLRRADGSAVFFPARLTSGVISDLRGEFPRYETQIAFLFADRNTVALIHSKQTHHLEVDLQRIAFLDSSVEQGAPRWLVQNTDPYSARVPAYAWWVELQEKFADLGMAWRGSQAQLHDDPARIELLRQRFPKNWGEMNEPEPVDLGPCQTSRLIGAFRGGLFEPGLVLATSWWGEAQS